jgi:hypothetical protein
MCVPNLLHRLLTERLNQHHIVVRQDGKGAFGYLAANYELPKWAPMIYRLI